MSGVQKAWVNLFFFIITLVINFMGALGLINGLTQKEVSDMFPTLITPAPVTFSIWGIIYLLLLISLIVMIVKNEDTYYENATDNITVLFRLSCLFNIAWIISFSYVQIGLSVIFIFGLVITLALISQKLLEIQEEKQFLLPLTFGLYTGWLFIASVVNVAALLVKLDWDRLGLSEEIWAIIVLAAAVVLVFFVLLKNNNAVFPLPIAWAYFGIYLALKSQQGYNGEYVLVEITAIVGMFILILMSVIQFFKNKSALLPKTT